MPETIIGRDAEKKILKDMLDSKEAELIDIFGRRRVGKLFLSEITTSKGSYLSVREFTRLAWPNNC